MAEPTIIKIGKYELAKLQFQGREPLLGIRVEPYTTWDLVGAVYDLAIAVSLIQTGANVRWAEFYAPIGIVPELSTPSVAHSSVAGADKRGNFTGGAPSQGNLMQRNLFVALGQILPGLRVDSILDRVLLYNQLVDLYINPQLFEDMVPVDADASQHSEGVNYGYAV